MSFNWNDEVEPKKYEYEGSVTISIEEYRDLIQEKCELRNAGKEEHEKWFKEYMKVVSLESKLNEFNEWFDSDIDAKLNFEEWKYDKEHKEKGGDE